MKTKIMLVATVTTLLLSGCVSYQPMPQANVEKKIVPKFTTVDRVVKLKTGMSYDDVVVALSCPPYDVYTINYETQKTVYIWYYRKIQRSAPVNVIDAMDGGTIGDNVLIGECCNEFLYCTFDADKKLEKAITDAGKGTQTIAPVGNTTDAPAEQQPEKKGIMKFLGN